MSLKTNSCAIALLIMSTGLLGCPSGDGGSEGEGEGESAQSQRVEVQFFGPVAESYPVQAVAGRLVVLE